MINNFSVELAKSNDATVICTIRDTAWIDTYPNPALGITKQDIVRLAKGRNNDFEPRRIEYLRKYIESQNDKTHTVIMATTQGKSVGYGIACIRDGKSWISNIYVLPDFQRQHIGGALMNKLLEWLGNDNDIYLEVVSYNEKAISFYTKYGFVVTSNAVEREDGKPLYLVDLPQVEMKLSKTGS